MKRSMTVPYAAIQMFYIMVCGGIATFISAFLLPMGYTSTDIGLILSSSNLISIVLQPAVAAIASRRRGRPLYAIICMIVALEMVAVLPLMFVSKKSVLLTLLYVLLMASHSVINPLINALSNRAKAHGQALNFGACRGMGSAGYALVNAALGFIIPHVGSMAIPGSSLVCAVGLLATLALSAKHWPREDLVSGEQDAGNEESWLSFFKHNKAFVVINVGCILMMFAQYVMQAYLLQIIQPLGGTSAEMGRILSLCGILEIPAMFAFDSLLKKFKNNTLLKISMLGMLCKAVLTFAAPSVGMVYVSHLFQMIGFALYYPAMIQLIGEKLDARSAIRAQTLFALATTVSNTGANFAGGILIDSFGVGTLGWVCMVLFAVGSVTILAALGREKKAAV